MPSSRTRELRDVAERIAAALPPVVREVVLTGSVSRGVADELSDIEMLLVTATPLDLVDCFEQAHRAGLADLDTWGPQGTEVSRVFGYFAGVPVETPGGRTTSRRRPSPRSLRAGSRPRPTLWSTGSRSARPARRRRRASGGRRLTRGLSGRS